MNKLSSPLFNPLTLPNGNVLKNRLVMAPMTTCCGFYDGTVTDNLIDYYRERAGSIGTVIVECAYVDTLGPAFPGAIGIHNDDCIEGLSLLATAIKERGSKAVIQIYHGGRMVEPQLIGGQTPVGPSAIAIPRPNATVPVAMTAGEVEDMIEKFGEAVRRAIAAGFDGIEIHGANTYLIQQFFHHTPISARINGAAAAKTAPASRSPYLKSTGKWLKNMLLMNLLSVTGFHRKNSKCRALLLTIHCSC